MPAAAGSGAGAGPGAGQAAQRLSPEDLSILALENETVAGHACKVIVLPGAVDADRLRSSIAGRLHRAPRLCTRLAEIDGEPWWVPDPQLDLSAHVVEPDRAGAVDEAGSGPRWRTSSPGIWIGRGRCGASACCRGWPAAGVRWSGASTMPWRTA